MNLKHTPSILALLATTLLSTSFAHAEDSMSARIQKLEEEIALLKRQQEVEQEKAQAKAEKSANVNYDANGLKISSPDNRYSLKLGGYAQVDTRAFFDNSNTSNVDQFTLRTARPVLEATFDKDFSGRLVMDFGSNQTQLVDAYGQYKPDPRANVRVGKFKTPVGLERWQSEQEAPFIERSLTNNFVPARDVGMQVFGEMLPGQLEYQLAYTNGVADGAGGTTSSDTDNAKDVTARVFAKPFRETEIVPLRELGVGIAASKGNHNGSTTNTTLTSGYRTIGQSNFFTYSTGSYADGEETRINPQASYYYGSFGTMGEYIKTENEVNKAGSGKTTLTHEGWNAMASYVLTGENASFDGVKPANNFSLKDGNWGAWEVLARYAKLQLDDKTFPTYASLTSSAREAREQAVGVTWYLNHNLKLNFNYAETDFDRGATNGDREKEKAFLTRTQFRF